LKLTLGKAIALNAALRALDGHQRVVKQGENEQTVTVSYKLTGAVRKAVRRNLVALEPEIDIHNEAVSGKFRELANGHDRLDPNVPEEAIKIAQFTREQEHMLKEETDEMKLVEIAESALDLDANPIPGTVLAGLSPILKE
jgi:hypothetical protein